MNIIKLIFCEAKCFIAFIPNKNNNNLFDTNAINIKHKLIKKFRPYKSNNDLFWIDFFTLLFDKINKIDLLDVTFTKNFFNIICV